MPKDSGFGQGMCQKVSGGARQFIAHHRRQQGEVVVLHQHHRVLTARFLDNRVGEALVHGPVALPVGLAEHRAHVGHVAQRPHALVGEAEVIALLLLGSEPHAAQKVFLLARRQGHPVVAVDHIPVSAAAAVGDPGAGAGSHHRLDRGHQPAGGPACHDACATALVDIRLAVGHNDHLVAAELRAQQGLQPLRVPVGLGPLRAAILVFQFTQPGPQIGREGGQFGCGAGQGPDQTFSAQQRARAGNPAAPAELRDDHGRQRDHCAQARDEDDQVLPGVLAATLDETQVLQQHEVADPSGLGIDRMNAHMHRTAPNAQHRVRLGGDLCGPFAAKVLREVGRGAQQLLFRRAQSDRDQPFILRRAVEERLELAPAPIRHGIGDRFRQRVGDQRAAHVQVAREPAQVQPVHEWQGEVGCRGQDHDQRNQKTQLQAKSSHAWDRLAGRRPRHTGRKIAMGIRLTLTGGIAPERRVLCNGRDCYHAQVHPAGAPGNHQLSTYLSSDGLRRPA